MRNQICTRFARALSSLGQPFLAKGLGRIGSNCISQSSLLSRRARGCRNFSPALSLERAGFRYDEISYPSISVVEGGYSQNG